MKLRNLTFVSTAKFRNVMKLSHFKKYVLSRVPRLETASVLDSRRTKKRSTLLCE